MEAGEGTSVVLCALTASAWLQLGELGGSCLTGQVSESRPCVRLTGFEVSKPLHVRLDRNITTPTLVISQNSVYSRRDTAPTRKPSSDIEIPLSVEVVNGRAVWSTEGGHGEFKPLDESEPFKVPLVAGTTPILSDPECTTDSWSTAWDSWRSSALLSREQKYLLTVPPDTDLDLAKFFAPVVIGDGLANVKLQQMAYVFVLGQADPQQVTKKTLDARGVLYLECNGMHRAIDIEHARAFELLDFSDQPLSVSLKGSEFVELRTKAQLGNVMIETDVLRSLWVGAEDVDVDVDAKRLILGCLNLDVDGLRVARHRVEAAEICDLYAKGLILTMPDHEVTLFPDFTPSGKTYHLRWSAHEEPHVLTQLTPLGEVEARTQHAVAADGRDPFSEFTDEDLAKGTPHAVISGDGITFGIEPHLLRQGFSAGRKVRDDVPSTPDPKTITRQTLDFGLDL